MASSSEMVFSAVKVQVHREMTDRDFGREEYIQDCIERVRRGEEVLVTLGGFFTAHTLPRVLQAKYGSTGCVWFPGFNNAKEAVVLKLNELLASEGKANTTAVKVRGFFGGSNSDLLGIPYDAPGSLDGYFISLESRE